MSLPQDLKYTKDHEWVKIEGQTALVGITDHAQSALGDIVFLELPQIGRNLKTGETFGVVESIKAVSDLYSPLNGVVTETNSALIDNPAQINTDPYHNSWLIKVDVKSIDETKLLSPSDYDAFTKTL